MFAFTCFTSFGVWNMGYSAPWTLVVYGDGKKQICGGGTAEMIACAWADFSRVFFLTIVVVQNVGNVEPLSARMRNRVSALFFVFPALFTHFFILFIFFSFFLFQFFFSFFSLFFHLFINFFLFSSYIFFFFFIFFHNTCLTRNTTNSFTMSVASTIIFYELDLSLVICIFPVILF